MTEAEKTALHDSLQEMLHVLYSRDHNEIHARVLAFHETVKAKYPAHESYRLYHLVAGSTLRESCPHFDFPAPDSVQRFIEREWQQAFGGQAN